MARPSPLFAILQYLTVVLAVLWVFYAFHVTRRLIATVKNLEVPHDNATTTTNTTLLARHDNDLAFPYGPRWEAFSDQNALNRAKMGWYEAMSLIRAGIAAACARTPEFYRYFNEADFETVNNMLVAMLGDMGSGPKEMADTVHTFSVVYGGGPSIGLTTDVCGITPNLKGFTNSARPDGRGAAMVLCPRTFDWYNPPLSWYTCDAFKEPIVNENALVVGSIIVHELTHWFLLSYRRANVVIVDYGFAGARYLNPQGVPKDGYGAYNSQQLRKQNKDPVRNADNYNWFTFEAYWAAKCGKHFEDIPDPPQAKLRQDAPMETLPQDLIMDNLTSANSFTGVTPTNTGAVLATEIF